MVNELTSAQLLAVCDGLSVCVSCYRKIISAQEFMAAKEPISEVQIRNAALTEAAERARQLPVWKMCAEDVARNIEAMKENEDVHDSAS